MASKTKVSLTLDSDIVEELQADDANLSSHINEILRRDIESRQHRIAVRSFLDEIASRDGSPLPKVRAKYSKIFDELA